MLIYPAIDLKDGVCVRLMHGDFAQVTHYDQQPAARLTTFAAEGAEWIHIVDLDGAEAGSDGQLQFLKAFALHAREEGWI